MLILVILAGYNYWNFLRFGSRRQLPDPVPPVTESFHKDGYDDSWILNVDNGTVWVQLVDDKTLIHFQPLSRDFYLFEEAVGHIAPVTFECENKKAGQCDLAKPYKLYIKNVPVELLEIKKK